MVKTKRKSVRLSKEEEKKILKKANTAGLNFSQYVREAALFHQVIVVSDIKDLYVQVAKVGNNLNQLTMLCHQGLVTSPNLEETKEMLNQVQIQLEEVLKEVKKNSSY